MTETAPIVIGSSPSSGSTMLRVVLGRHPSILSGGELHALDRPALFDADRETLRDELPRWIAGAAPRPFVTGSYSVFSRAPEFGWPHEELIELGSACASWHELLQRFFERGVRENGRRRWLEKTPGNVFAFQRVREGFPDALFVHLLRDGRDVVASLMRLNETPFQAVSRWYCAVLAGRSLSGLDGYVELRYEDLVHAPEAELRRLCSFVHEDFHDALLEADPSARPAGRTWHAAEAGPVTSVAIGAHRDAEIDAILAHLANVRLTDAGHELVTAGGAAAELRELTPLEVLEQLGYDAGSPRPRGLTRRERDAAAAEARAYEEDEMRRHGRLTYRMPTRLA